MIATDFFKRIDLAGYDRAGPHLFHVGPDVDRSIGHIKMARPMPPRVEHYIRTAKPVPGKSQLLIDALGAGEYWGSNVNGDWFAEATLRHPGKDYGYETFEHYAYPFKHHVNKDPKAAYGERVTLAEYDPHMHRVLLIVTVDDQKCRDILEDLENGKYWDVSMGCFMAGTLVTMADGTRKPIEEVQVGDMVITHRGRARKVTTVHRRPYKGNIHNFRAEAHQATRCTHQHPFWAIDDTQVIHYPGQSKRRWMDDVTIAPNWVHAECIDDHLLLEPVIDETLTPDYVSRAFARLFGYYLAEGHVLRDKQHEIVGLQLTTNKNDAVHDEIDALCAEFGTKNPPVTSPHQVSEESLYISIHDARLARLCYEHGGGYAQRKRLSYEALRWDPAMQREIIGAYANGDGCGSEDGSIGLSSSSTSLAWQFVALLPRIGIIPSITNLEHKASSGFSAHVTYEWVVHIGKQFAQTLRDVCAKVQPSTIIKTKRSRTVYSSENGDRFIVTPIRESDVIYAETEVWNLEVEEDSSYLANGLAVHNCRVPWDECSICLRHARNRKEYCDDLKYRMNRVLPDGRQVVARNTYAKFFDISFVIIGAEKASHVLQKVASVSMPYEVRSSAMLADAYFDKVAATAKIGRSIKEADIDKQVPSNIPPSKDKIRKLDGAETRGLADLVDQAGAVKATERPIDNGTLDGLTDFPLKEIFSTLTALGIPLRPEEFQRIVLVKTGHAKLANFLHSRRLVFDEHQPAAELPGWARGFDRFNPGAVNEKIASALRPYLTARSCYPEILAGRIERTTKLASISPESTTIPAAGGSVAGQFAPLSRALAAAFLAIKNQFPQLGDAGLAGFLEQHPWLLPVLVASGVGAMAGMHELTTSGATQSRGRLLDGIGGAQYDAHDKTASSASPWLRFGMVPLAYIYAGIQQRRAQNGEPLGSVDRFIADRPDLAALSSFATAPMLARGVRRLLKTGSALSDIALYTVGAPSKFMPGVLAGAALDTAIIAGITRLAQGGSPKERPNGRTYTG